MEVPLVDLDPDRRAWLQAASLAGPRARAARAVFTAAGIRIGRPTPPLDSWLRVPIGRATENDAVIRVLDATFSRTGPA